MLHKKKGYLNIYFETAFISLTILTFTHGYLTKPKH